MTEFCCQKATFLAQGNSIQLHDATAIKQQTEPKAKWNCCLLNPALEELDSTQQH